ncbi:MAG: hypothetical protein U0T81_04665 [Saprospiraceae bacterium]
MDKIAGVSGGSPAKILSWELLRQTALTWYLVFRWLPGFPGVHLIGRLTRDGKVLWMKRIGRNTELFGRDITATKDGGFIIAGSTGYYGTDATADDIYLVKIDGYKHCLEQNFW